MQISNPAPGRTLSSPNTTVYNATKTTSWQDLDLSAVVGAKITLVLLKVLCSAANNKVTFRRNGDAAEYHRSDGNPAAVAHGYTTTALLFFVDTDALGIVEWKVHDAVSTMTVIVATFLN